MYSVDDVLEIIFAELEKKNLKPTHLAKGIGYTASWMTQIKKKDVNLSVKNLLKMANFLKIEPNLLMPGKKEIKKIPKISLNEFIDLIIKIDKKIK